LIVEKNFAVGEIVDTDLNLFRLLQPGRKGVRVEAYKDELPVLESLRPRDRTWRILSPDHPGATGVSGEFERIDFDTDPVTENGKVLGWVDDPKGLLKFGQRIRAAISLPSAADQVAIPEAALFSDGQQNLVFVANRLDARFVMLRQIEPIRLLNGKYLVRASVTEKQRLAGLQPLLAGECVVDRGSLQLYREFQRLRSVQSAAAVPGPEQGSCVER
jgi:cobalt-zinc-cadmium efflux system membrane fusion protein